MTWPFLSALRRPGNDCARCADVPELRLAWGCDRDSVSGPWGAGHVYDLAGTLSRRCPLASARDPYVSAALAAFAHWERGVHPARITAHYDAAMMGIAALQAKAETWYREESDRGRR